METSKREVRRSTLIHTHVHTLTLSHTHHSIDPDLKSVVYRIGIAHGSDEDWDYMWQQYNMATDPYEKRLYLVALAQSTEPWILSR